MENVDDIENGLDVEKGRYNSDCRGGGVEDKSGLVLRLSSKEC